MTTSETASGRVANPRPLAVPGVVGTAVGSGRGIEEGVAEGALTALANPRQATPSMWERSRAMAESQVRTLVTSAGERSGVRPLASAPTTPTHCGHCGGRYVPDGDGDLQCFACGRAPEMGEARRAALMAEMDALRDGKHRLRQPIPGGVWRDDETYQLELIAS